MRPEPPRVADEPRGRLREVVEEAAETEPVERAFCCLASRRAKSPAADSGDTSSRFR